MALLYLEKFAKYSLAADIVDDNPTYGNSSGLNAMVASGGRFGERCASLGTNSATVSMPWAAVAGSTTAVIMMTINCAQTSLDATRPIIEAIDNIGDFHWRLSITTAGNLVVLDSDNFAVAVAPFGFGVWRRVEIKVSMVGSGNMEVRVDGVTVINVAGDFRDGTTDAIPTLRFYGSTSSNNFRIDELIVCDDTGSDFNDFLGDMRIEASVADADGSITDWTPSSGTSISCVDDPLAGYDAGTTNISSSTTDQDTYFTHTVSAPDHTDIMFAALAPMIVDDGSNTFRHQVNSNGTIDRGPSDINPTTLYSWYTRAWALDPDTAAPWTLAAINAAEFGVRCRP